MKLEQSVAVDATPERIWAVLADVERWPEWTASMRKLEIIGGGALGTGSRVRVEQPRLPTTLWRVRSFEQGREFTWVAGAPGLRTVASHGIDANPSGGATVTLSIDQTGALAWLFSLLTGSLTRRYVDLEAQGLKKRAEIGQ